MNYYRCDNCDVEVESNRKGVYCLLPNGWYVIADGPLNHRETELHVCSHACMEARVAKVALLGTMDTKKLVVKQIVRQEAALEGR